MKSTLFILRAFGVAVGLWLLFSAGTGLSKAIPEFSRLLASSSHSNPASILFGIFAPVFGVALLLLLPWSRIRPAAVWWPLFLLFMAAAAIWLRQLLLPYVTLWRPSVLWEHGILQPIIFYALLLIVQLAAIFAVRHLHFHAHSQSNRYA